MIRYELTPSDEINRRIRRLQEEMKEKEIDLAFVIQNVDLFYFSGSIQRGYLFVPCHGMESSAGAGELPGHIYERMQEIAEKEGLVSNFIGVGQGKVSFVGHGLGLEINEWPILRRGEKKSLQSGMVIAFEPKFVFPNEGAVGIEVDFIVREQGLERVTQFPKDVVYL